MSHLPEFLRGSATSSGNPQASPRPSLLREESGQDTIEFALVASFVSIVSILALRSLSPEVLHAYSAVRFALITVTTALF